MNRIAIVLSSLLLQAIQPWYPTPVLTRLRAEQRYVSGRGLWQGTVEVELQSNLEARDIRLLFPASRRLETVSQGGKPLRFSQQGGLLQIQLPLTDSGQPVTLPLRLSFSSEPEGGFAKKVEQLLQDYRLSYQADLTQARFEALSILSVRAPQRKSLRRNDLPQLPMRHLKLGLNAGLQVISVQRQGQPQRFQRRGGQLRILLDPPLQPGQSASLEIRYGGTLPTINRYQIWDLPLSGGLYYYPAHPLRPGAY